MLKLLQSRVLDVPLLVTSGKLYEIVSVLDRDSYLKIELDTQDPTTYAYQDQHTGPISHDYPTNASVIPITGTLVHKVGGIRAASGLMSYDSIISRFRTALEDADTDVVVLDVHSPGGEVSGAFDAADYIYNSRGTKPILAFANDLCCSAAYCLASSADTVYATRTALIGSIGVRMLLTDRSEANTKSGIKYIEISAGKHKVDGSPNAPISEDAIKRAQSRVNQIYDVFTSTVSRNLDINEKSVRDTEALIYMGQEAVNIGLAHEITTKFYFIEHLTKHNTGVKHMAKTPDRIITDGPNSPKMNIPEPIPQLITQADVDKAVQDATASAIKTERDRCFEVLEACVLGDCISIATDMILDGSSPDTARKMVLSMKNATTQSTTVHSNVPATIAPSENPLLKDAKARAVR